MNEIRVQGLLLDRYNTDFLGLLHKLNRTVCTPTSAPTSVPAPTCSVSKSCGAGRTWIGEMRGPLREKIQNVINRALSDHLDSQAALITVGGRRRNRKKKNKKNAGVTGSVWATLQQQAAVPPIRSQLDIPPKSKASPQVTKTKKNKENKGKLSPPKCRKEKFDQDHKPLIGGEAVNEDPALLDQENLDPNSMPFELFKKKNKTKRAKDKEAEVAENEVTDIIAEPLTLAESKETSVLVEENVANQTSSSDEGLTEVGEMTMKEVKSEQLYNEIFESAEPKLDTENLIQETSLEDSPAVLPTDDITDPVTSTEEEGPQLSVEDAISAQPNKLEDVGVDGKGRERESLLRDHNPEGLVCCTIL